MGSTYVVIGLSKMDLNSAICHLTLMARPFLQKNCNSSSFAREQQFYFIRQLCARLDDKEVKRIDQNSELFFLRKDASKRLIFLNGCKNPKNRPLFQRTLPVSNC